MTYPIVLYGEPVLEKPAETVEDFDTPELNKLVDDMFESMYAARGVGLAATQIGISKRIAVIDLSVGEFTGQGDMRIGDLGDQHERFLECQ